MATERTRRCIGRSERAEVGARQSRGRVRCIIVDWYNPEEYDVNGYHDWVAVAPRCGIHGHWTIHGPSLAVC